MEPLLSAAALALYGAATAAAFAFLLGRDEGWSSWTLRSLGLGAAVHLCAYILRLRDFWAFAENRYLLPVNTFHGALSLLALAVAATFFIIERSRRLGILGAFVLPWTVLFAGAAAACPAAAAAPLPPVLRSWMMNLHPVLLMCAYAALANAFGVGAAFLLQDRQIKSRSPAALCYRLPSIEELDRLEFRIVAAGSLMMAAGIVMGGTWAARAWSAPWVWDAKMMGTYVTAAVYAAYLYLHAAKGWHGRRGVLLAMCGFASLLLTFIAGDVMSRLHGHLSGRG